MTSVSLRPRKQVNLLCKPDSQTIDFARVNAHLGRLRGKYESNLATFKALQGDGKEHPWCQKIAPPNVRSDSESSHTATNEAATVAAAAAVAKAQAQDPNRDKGQTLLARIRQSMHRKKEAKKGQQTAPTTSNGTKTGTVALTDESEQLWHGPITLGGQTIEVDFDTGSSDIILNKGAYKPTATAKKTGKTFKTAYGDGTTASGQVYLDTLEIGGLKADGAAIGLADTTFLNASEGDQGIAGMAFPPLAELQQPPFFDVLLNAGVLDKPVFTFTLRDTQPTLTLGGIPDGVSGTPTYVSVDASQGFWGTRGTINGTSVNGIQDTGTTLIVAPTSVAKALFAKLGLTTFTEGDSLYATLEGANATPPTITIQFGDYSRTLTPDTLTFGNTNDGKPVLSIIGANVGIDAVIFGDPWLRNVVAVFSRAQEGPQIGFIGQ